VSVYLYTIIIPFFLECRWTTHGQFIFWTILVLENVAADIKNSCKWMSSLILLQRNSNAIKLRQTRKLGAQVSHCVVCVQSVAVAVAEADQGCTCTSTSSCMHPARPSSRLLPTQASSPFGPHRRRPYSLSVFYCVPTSRPHPHQLFLSKQVLLNRFFPLTSLSR
jgi:hypothetical protein